MADRAPEEPGIVYLPYEDGMEGQIVELFRLVFQRPYSRSRWFWEYRANPLGGPRAVLATCGSRVVGQSAAVPLRFICDGEPVRAARVQNVMVHPDFRNRGVFLETLRRLDSLLRRGDGSLVYAFPNDYSLKAFVEKLGYLHLHDMEEYSLPVADAPPPVGGLRFDFRGDGEFDGGDSAFMRSRTDPFTLCAERSPEFMKWRYHRESGRRYSVLRVFDSGEMSALVVFKVYPPRGSIDLVEFLSRSDPQLIASALGALRDHCGEGKVKTFNLWSARHYPWHGVLVDLGFAASGPVTHVVFGGMGPKGFEGGGGPGNWYFSMGDSDVY